MGYCKFFENCGLSYDSFTDEILFYKCCVKCYIPIKRIPTQVFLKEPNLVEYLNKNFINLQSEDTGFRDNWCNSYIQGRLEKCETQEQFKTFKNFDIDIDASCNMNCDFCYNRGQINNIKEKKLNFKVKTIYFYILNNILKNLNYPASIRLTDHGEPFFWKKDTLEFLKKAEESPYVTEVLCNSNCSILCDDLFANEIKKLSKLKIRCSINALNSDLYFKRMKKDIFNKIIDLAINLPQISEFSYVIENYDHYEDFRNNISTFRNYVSQPIYVIDDIPQRPNSIDSLHKIIKDFGKEYNIH